MSFLETVERARAFLERNGRVSLRALQGEFDLDEGALEELIEELVEIQRVAVREGRALAWSGGGPAASTRAPEHERAPRDYTPKHLADKILRSRSALEGEHKQVTVLFVDVQRNTELSRQVGNEAWHEILDGFFQVLADGVHRFEGTVNQYTGDGIMALFGAPLAHEDHAQRACYAALYLRDQLRSYSEKMARDYGIDFQVRTGLNSGDVVVGKIGDDLRMDYTAQGEIVNLAARMEALAGAGETYLAENTARLVEGYFDLDDTGAHEVKGAEGPLRVYALKGVGRQRTRLEVAETRGLTAFVGRSRELSVIEGALEQSLAGTGQIVGVVGEAGVGKSRLCLEFVRGVRQRGVPVMEAHCPPIGSAEPFGAILQLLRAAFRLRPNERDADARDRVAATLADLDPAFEESLPLVFDFLGMPDPERPAPPMDPAARERRLLRFVGQLVQAQSRRQPALVFLDDAHWIDGPSDTFLAAIAGAVSGTRTLLLVNFRPEYRADWMSGSDYSQLPLRALGPGDAETLLQGLIGGAASNAALLEKIRRETEGNPFFIEEVVQSLVESGALEGERGAYRLVESVESISIPATVQAVVAARIDRLEEREKHVLQTASVIGREVPEALLARVVELPETGLDASLASLRRGEFLHEAALFPDVVHEFKHPLIRQVAYDSQLHDRRSRTHAAVASALEELHGGADEQAALLAHHWEEAGEALPAAAWHRRAAEWLLGRGLTEAHRHLKRVLALTADRGEGAALWDGLRARSMLLHVGLRIGLGPDEIESLASEGRLMAEARGDPRSGAQVQRAYALCLLAGGQAAASLVAARHNMELADESGDPATRVLARCTVSEALLQTGDLHGALSLTHDVLEVLEGDDQLIGLEWGGMSIHPWQLGRRGWIQIEMGRPVQAAPDLESAIEALRELSQPEPLSWCLSHMATLEEMTGNGYQAASRCQEALELAEELGSSLGCGLALAEMGRALLAAGRPEDAIAPLEETCELMQKRAGVNWRAVTFAALAEAYLRVGGDRERARAMADDAVRYGHEGGYRGWVIRAHLAQARVLRALDGASAEGAIDQTLATAEALIEETGARCYAPFVAEERARLSALVGRDELALLRKAHRLFIEVGATGHAERVARELGC